MVFERRNEFPDYIVVRADDTLRRQGALHLYELAHLRHEPYRTRLINLAFLLRAGGQWPSRRELRRLAGLPY